MSGRRRGWVFLGLALALILAGGVAGSLAVVEQRRVRHWTIPSPGGTTPSIFFAEQGRLFLAWTGDAAELYSVEHSGPVLLGARPWLGARGSSRVLVSPFTDVALVQSGVPGVVEVRSLRSSQVRGAFLASRAIWTGAVTRDLLALVSDEHAPRVDLRALPSGTIVRSLEAPPEVVERWGNSLAELRFSPDERLLLVCYGSVEREVSVSCVWEVATGRVRASWNEEAVGFTSRGEVVFLAREGRAWGPLVARALEGGGTSRTLVRPRPRPYGWELVLSGELLALLSGDAGSAFVEPWSLERGVPLGPLRLRDVQDGWFLALSSEGDEVAFSTGDAIDLWQLPR